MEVYARFVAIDQQSGRVSSYLTRKMALRVTELVEPFIRVSDPKIATLTGLILQGRSMGRTEVQVLSPINGRVIGSREIRVGSDKVSIARLAVQVVSGLQLNISPDGVLENGYVAETLVTRHLTAQYQEGLLDIDIEFSDGVKTPLRDVSADNYFLLVESLDTEVVAFAPMLASNYPRVIAVGEGNGDLLRVTLLLPEECRVRRNNQLNRQVISIIEPSASSEVFISKISVRNLRSRRSHKSRWPRPWLPFKSISTPSSSPTVPTLSRMTTCLVAIARQIRILVCPIF